MNFTSVLLYLIMCCVLHHLLNNKDGFLKIFSTVYLFHCIQYSRPGGERAFVAQLDVRPTGDQEVAGLTPAKVGNILSLRFDHEIFSMVILSLPLIQEGHLSVSGERLCTIPVNSLED